MDNDNKVAIIGSGIPEYEKEIIRILDDSTIIFRNDRQSREPILAKSQRKRHQPYQTVQLSKAERRGKTPVQIQELRAQKWERLCRERMEEGDNHVHTNTISE
jgi:hypothetical protein